MGIFSLFSQKNQVEAPIEKESSLQEEKNNLPEIKREDFVDDSDPNQENNIITIRYGTGLPIDAIYAYIEEDYEQIGYDDAMCNTDITYKESKKTIIKNGLKRLFEQIRLRYKSDIRDIDVQIDAVEAQGLTYSSESLKARKETFIEHMNTMDKMEASLDREESQMLSMINSYERGFLKGLSAKSESFINKR